MFVLYLFKKHAEHIDSTAFGLFKLAWRRVKAGVYCLVKSGLEGARIYCFRDIFFLVDTKTFIHPIGEKVEFCFF